ncbi:hypothetical protein [Chlorobium sp. N1]|uniref:hypothetical protein n=1 Tax=Chlorobium sp. N1 TaxID=2491138 RepID=UPI00103C4614|nr:hypothetical protein [Chlorobium sp. N1]TCD47020.1 hypothetical protein E0L29_10320 [Chlorobium sp. N1]
MALKSTAYLPAVYHTGILRGDTFRERFSFRVGGEPLLLAGAGVRVQLRRRAGTLVGSFEVGAGIEIEGEALVWTIESGATAGYLPGEYQYDIEITTGTTVRTYLSGTFTVEKDVTA